jgi:hypothetical protein
MHMTRLTQCTPLHTDHESRMELYYGRSAREVSCGWTSIELRIFNRPVESQEGGGISLHALVK